MKNFFKSFVYAINGLRFAVRDQRNFRIQLIIAALVVAAGLYFRITGTDWVFVLLAIALVMSLELMNSAVESLVDLVTNERKPLAGKVKDIAAGSVLFASLIALIIGAIVFGKYAW
jgi:diacylglycerol kinase